MKLSSAAALHWDGAMYAGLNVNIAMAMDAITLTGCHMRPMVPWLKFTEITVPWFVWFGSDRNPFCFCGGASTHMHPLDAIGSPLGHPNSKKNKYSRNMQLFVVATARQCFRKNTEKGNRDFSISALFHGFHAFRDFLSILKFFRIF